jgi:hypothetical protein
MNVGITTDPTVVAVLVEDEGLRFISTTILDRVSIDDQAEILRGLVRTYRPEAIGFDTSGVGLPLCHHLLAKDIDLGAQVYGFNPASKRTGSGTQNLKDYADDTLEYLLRVHEMWPSTHLGDDPYTADACRMAILSWAEGRM